MSPASTVQMTQSFPVQMAAPASQAAGVFNGTGQDLQDYEGVVEFSQNLGAITGSVGTNKLQEADLVGGPYTDVNQGTQVFGVTANTVSSVKVNISELKRWIRYTATVTTGPALVGVTAHGFKKSR